MKAYNICRFVARHCSVSNRNMMSRSRKGSFARHVAMYLLYTRFQLTPRRAARVFGMDEVNVRYAVRKIEEARAAAHFHNWLSRLEVELDEAAFFENEKNTKRQTNDDYFRASHRSQRV